MEEDHEEFQNDDYDAFIEDDEIDKRISATVCDAPAWEAGKFLLWGEALNHDQLWDDKLICATEAGKF